MRQTGLPVLHSPSSGMSMAALQWKAHRQVITPSVANGRLPCDAIGSQRIESQSRAQESFFSPPTQWRPQFMSLELRRWRRGTWRDEEEGKGEEKGEEPGESAADGKRRSPKTKLNNQIYTTIFRSTALMLQMLWSGW